MKFTFAPEARPLDGYTIKRAIHRGGFGEVYYALSDAGKEVALKLLNNNLEVELRGVRQCLNLKHTNLVTIFDIREDGDNDHWVVMEYVGGPGLYETLQGYPEGMPLNEVLAWLTGMTAGLSFLHDRGIVHRDLKPANVFRDQGQVKIGDVGLSKYISESRRSAQTQSVGTVYYMAPEVARGRYGREVDVYAMGIMLYEMLTGNVPFDGQTTAEILMKHLTAEPDLSVLPQKLRPVIMGALEKDPDQRISTVEELENKFRAAVSGENASIPVTLPRTKTERAAAAESVSNPRATQRPERSPVLEDTVISDAPPSSPKTALAAAAALWNSIPQSLQFVIGGAIALLIIEADMLRPLAVGGIIGGAAFLGYQMLRMVTENVEKKKKNENEQVVKAAGVAPPPPPPPAGVSPQPSVQPKRERFRRARKNKPTPQSPRTFTPATLRSIPAGYRATDLFSSLSLSLIAVSLVTVAVFYTTDMLGNMTHAVYFAAVTMLASWAVIVPSKLWEGRSADGLARRLVMATLGIGVGLVAGELPKFLLVDQQDLFRGAMATPPVAFGRVVLSDGSGNPTTASLMLFFAVLFAARRWWWQADSFRSSRFRVTSALLTLLVGMAITGALQEVTFPDALGVTWALALSAVVQLSSGWTPHADRQKLTEEQQQVADKPREEPLDVAVEAANA